MIELTEQQAEALERPDAAPPRVRNPRTQETYVLLRADEYARLIPADPLPPADDWERGLLAAARDCGVSLPDEALSSDGLYD